MDKTQDAHDISPPGLILRNERKKRGLSIADVAQVVRIRKEYLIAIEDDTIHKIPSSIYAQGYIQIYSQYLGIEISKIPTQKVGINTYYTAPTKFIESNYLKSMWFFCALGISLVLYYATTTHNKTAHNHLLTKISTYNVKDTNFDKKRSNVVYMLDVIESWRGKLQ